MGIRQQQGAVLVVGLILLAVVVILTTTSMNLTSLSEIMTSNQKDKEISYQASESALSDGESWLANLTDAPEALNTCPTPPCSVVQEAVYANLANQDGSWWQTYGTAFSATIPGVGAQPRYVIEFVHFVPYELSPDAQAKGNGYYTYQVSAHGTGTSGDTRSVVQSTYVVQYR